MTKKIRHRYNLDNKEKSVGASKRLLNEIMRLHDLNWQPSCLEKQDVSF